MNRAILTLQQTPDRTDGHPLTYAVTSAAEVEQIVRRYWPEGEIDVDWWPEAWADLAPRHVYWRSPDAALSVALGAIYRAD